MIKVKETATQFRLLQCVRLLGDLSVHISGESRVMFKKEPDDNYFTHYFVTLSGDQGCVAPLDNAPCALDEMKKILSGCIPWMYQNDEGFDHYITEEFKQWFTKDVGETICGHFNGESTETVVCEFIPKGEIDPITVITVSALTNVFATDIFEETEDAEFIGKILNVVNVIDEDHKFTLTVKIKRKELSVTIDTRDKFIMLGVTDIHKARFVYKLKDGTYTLSPVQLHGTERGSIITEVYRAEQ